MKYSKLKMIKDNLKLLDQAYGADVKFGFGLGLIFAGFVLGIKSTKDNVDEIREAEQEVIDVHENKDDTKFYKSDADYRRAVGQAYKKLGLAKAKTYGPGFLCMMVGTVILCKNHKDMRDDQFQKAVTIGALTKELNDFYARTEEKYGKEEAQKLRYGLEEREIEVKERDANGVEKTVVKKVTYVSPDWNGHYTYRWTKTSSTWKPNRMLREAMVNSIEQYGNDLLQIRADTNKIRKGVGWVWLNEMLNAFDIEIEDAGQDTGWIYELGNTIGDNYIEISMTDAYETNPMTGQLEEVTLLTFNVDGGIRDRVFPKSRVR